MRECTGIQLPAAQQQESSSRHKSISSVLNFHFPIHHISRQCLRKRKQQPMTPRRRARHLTSLSVCRSLVSSQRDESLYLSTRNMEMLHFWCILLLLVWSMQHRSPTGVFSLECKLVGHIFHVAQWSSHPVVLFLYAIGNKADITCMVSRGGKHNLSEASCTLLLLESQH